MKIEDKKELTKLISFIAMCDGSVHKNGGTKNNVFSFSQTVPHKDIVDWVAGVVGNVTSCRILYTERPHPRKNIYKLQTLSHPFFNTIRDRIYIGNYKGLDIHALKMLDWQSLAIMYMCDGCLGRHKRPNGTIQYTTTLNLCRLSYGDQFILKKALKERLELEWNIVKTNRKYYTLRIRAKDQERFMQGIAPYVFDSFQYKLNLRTTNP